jgi:hypothetical protein
MLMEKMESLHAMQMRVMTILELSKRHYLGRKSIIKDIKQLVIILQLNTHYMIYCNNNPVYCCVPRTGSMDL